MKIEQAAEVEMIVNAMISAKREGIVDFRDARAVIDQALTAYGFSALPSRAVQEANRR